MCSPHRIACDELCTVMCIKVFLRVLLICCIGLVLLKKKKKKVIEQLCVKYRARKTLEVKGTNQTNTITPIRGHETQIMTRV